jgi:hypothetical protein
VCEIREGLMMSLRRGKRTGMHEMSFETEEGMCGTPGYAMVLSTCIYTRDEEITSPDRQRDS